MKNSECVNECHLIEKDEDWLDKVCKVCRTKWFVEEAVSHGIPRSVAEGKTMLSDHFSEDYINWKCGKDDE